MKKITSRAVSVLLIAALIIAGMVVYVLDDVDIAFYGEYKELTEEDRATIRDMVSVMRKRRASEK